MWSRVWSRSGAARLRLALAVARPTEALRGRRSPSQCTDRGLGTRTTGRESQWEGDTPGVQRSMHLMNVNVVLSSQTRNGEEKKNNAKNQNWGCVFEVLEVIDIGPCELSQSHLTIPEPIKSITSRNGCLTLVKLWSSL